MRIGVKETDSPSLLWIILGIALLLRLNGLTAFSLSNDELSALARLQFDSVGEVIRDGVYVDFHPAGVQVFLYYWTKIFGFSEFAVRIPFALMGVGAVYFLFHIGRLWFGVATGLLAAASLAVLEFPLLYSQIARPYSSGLLVCLMAAYFWTRVVFVSEDNKATSRNYLIQVTGFVLSVAACMYNHYFSFIFAGLLCLAGLFFMKRYTLLPYLSAGFFIALLYLPHLDIFIHQLSKGGVGGADGWLGPPQSDAVNNYINYSFNDSLKLKYIFVIILLGTILAYRGLFKLSKFHVLSLLLFSIPVAIAYYYSIYKNPVFQYSVLLFSFPFLLLFIFSFIPADKKGFTLIFLLFIVITAGAYSTVTEKKYYSTPHFTEFRAIAKGVIALDEKYGEENITKTISVFHPYYINYYLEKFNHPTKFEIYGIFERADKQEFFRIVEESKKDYFLYAYSNVYTPPEFDVVIRAQFPWILVNDSMLRSGYKLYGRNRVDYALNTLPALELNYGFETGKWENEAILRDSVKFSEGNYSIKLSVTDEFSPGLNSKLSEISIEPGSNLEVSAALFSPSDTINSKLVVSIEHEGQTLYWKGVGASDFFREKEMWFRTYMVAEIPREIPRDAQLKIYLWNEKKEIIWMDDFRMSVYSPRL